VAERKDGKDGEERGGCLVSFFLFRQFVWQAWQGVDGFSLIEFYVKIISWSEKQNFEPLLVEA